MSWKRIWSILVQDFYITRRSMEVIIDNYLFSVMGTLVFGFASRYLFDVTQQTGAYYLLLGVVLWEIVRVTQYSISVSSMWNIWSRNFGNMFVAPLTFFEYLVGRILVAVTKSLVTLAIVASMAQAFFDLHILSLGIANLALFFVNLSVFAWSLGLIILGIIFVFGIRLAALSWGVVFLFQPLCAAYFPVSLLPQPLRGIALALPPTHVFEAARRGLTHSGIDLTQALWMCGLNAVYLTATILLFRWMLGRSQSSGQFVKLDA